MIIYLHNPRCSKSRDWLKLIWETKRNFTLRGYLTNPMDYGELIDLQEKLWIKAIEFTRTNEVEFSENNLSKSSSDTEILKAMARFPKLMQRPIIFDETRAFIWRPVEDILKIFKK